MLDRGERSAGGWAVAKANSVLVVAGVSVLAFVLRAHTALAHIETQDERTWMVRSRNFSDALHNGDLADVSAAPQGTAYPKTMPGVTTMWVGTVARWVWSAGRHVGLWVGEDVAEHGGGDTFATTRSGLQVAQLGMALATAALVGLVAFLVTRWAGRWAGAVAGLLIASEPFIVAHGALLHTDELLSLFGVASLVATALAFGLPAATAAGSGWQGRWWAAVVAGALGGAALLTKMSALMFLVGAAMLGAWALLRAWQGSDGAMAQRLRPTVALGGWWAASFVATVVVVYPALWARPLEEIGHLRRSAQLAGDSHLQYFLGEPMDVPGPGYYFVAVPLRVTPWLLVASVVAAVALWWRPTTRGFAGVLTCMAGSTFVTISMASKQFDRYGLPLMMLGSIAVGIAVGAAVRSASGGWAQRLQGSGGRRALVVVAGVLLVHGLVVSPWGLSYFNPLLGGSATGEQALLVGWGEGSDQVGPLIAELAHGDCDGVTVAGYSGGRNADFRCGRPAPAEEATFQVMHVSIRQRFPEDHRELAAGRELVGAVRIRGIDHFEVYGPK